MVSIIKKIRSVYEDSFCPQKRQLNWDSEFPDPLRESEASDLAEPAPKRRRHLLQMDDEPEHGYKVTTAISSFFNHLFGPTVPVLRQRSFNEDNVGPRLKREEPRVVGGVEVMPVASRRLNKTSALTDDVQFLRSSPSSSLRKKSFSLTPHPRTGTQLFRDDPFTIPSRMDPSSNPLFDLDADSDDVIDKVSSRTNLSWNRHSVHNVSREHDSSLRLNGSSISFKSNGFGGTKAASGGGGGGGGITSPHVRVGGNDGLVDSDGDSEEEEEKVKVMDGVAESEEVSIVGGQFKSPGVSRFSFRPTLTSTAERNAAKVNRFHLRSRQGEYKIPAVSRSGICSIRKQSRDLFNRPSAVLSKRPYPSSSSVGVSSGRRGLLASRGCSNTVTDYMRKLGIPKNYHSTARDCYKLKDMELYTEILKQSSTSEQCFSRSSSVFSMASSVPLSKVQMDQEWTRKTTNEILESMSQKKPAESSKKDISLWTLDDQIKRNDRAMDGKSIERSSEAQRATGDATAARKGVKPKDKKSPEKVEDDDDDDDDIVITKETVRKVVAPNSLEQQARFRAFYRFTPDWVEENRARCNKKKVDLERQRHESELTLKMCLERRKAGPSVEDAVTRRFKMLDMRHPCSVIDMSEEDVLTELTPDMEKVISNALRKHPPGEVLTEKFNIQITRRDIATLDGLNWLNDEVVNFYMNLLMERGQNDNYPSVYAFNTFFYPKIIKMGFSGVKRWTKKVDIFNHELLLVPVHLGMHWCLATINVKDKLISYYDSMLGDNNQCLQELKKYLQDEHMDKKKTPLDLSGWKCVTLKDIPQQMNGSDCGMFACKFSEYLSRRRPITFTQDHMPYFRRRMVYEIVTNRLL